MSAGHENNKISFEELYKTYRSFNEIEKRKAIKSNVYPQPVTIKQHLGNTLGKIIIDLIPDDVQQLLKHELNGRTAPKNFEVTVENVLLDNIKLTEMEIVDRASVNIDTIIRVGEELKHRIYPDEQHNQEMKLDDFIKCFYKPRNEEILFIETMKYEQYEINRANISDNYYNQFILMLECHIGKFETQLEGETERLVVEVDKQLKTAVETSRDTFNYHMQLARGELFEEYLNEKCEMELKWEKTVEALNENHARALKNLQVSLNEDHVQKMADLENWYEEQLIRIRPMVNIKNMTVEIEQEHEVEDAIPYAIQLHEIDIQLQNKRNELMIYKKRLVYVLNGYIDFVKNCLRKQHGDQNQLRKQLFEAKSLAAKIKKIRIKQSVELFENRNAAASTKKKKTCHTKQKLTPL